MMVLFFVYAWSAWPAVGLNVREMCLAQMQAQSLPVACFQWKYQHQNQMMERSFINVVEQQCEKVVSSERQLDRLQEWARHPTISQTCRTAAQKRLEKLIYRFAAEQPWKVLNLVLEGD